jgi:SAM-dependent methyltransferase
LHEPLGPRGTDDTTNAVPQAPLDAAAPEPATAEAEEPAPFGTAPSSGEVPAAVSSIAPAEAPPVPDLETMKALLAPPIPAKVPFESVADLVAAYEFGTYPTAPGSDPGLVPYFDTHWRRYLATLALIEERPPASVLDVGVFPPFLFQALLARRFPGVALSGVWEGPQPFAQLVAPREAQEGAFRMALAPANVERDRLPVADGTHDLVLAMEILEHFALDPLHFFAEAYRVLRPGGRLLVTTPNIASHRGVRKILDMEAPYSFGIFVPTGGVYGRHNREYTPREVQRLGEAAGFTTARLVTADVYDDVIDDRVAALLAARGDDLALRGETILWLGEKPAESAMAGMTPSVPALLYHGDPRRLYASLALAVRDEQAGRYRVTVTNRSDLPWPGRGEGAVTLYLEWLNEAGDLVHGGVSLPLDTGLAPGASGDVALVLDARGTATNHGTLMIDLMLDGAGRVSGAGRSNRLRLPCSEAAYLRLAERSGAAAPGTGETVRDR